MPMSFTRKQGQYLAFIQLYTKLTGVPPAEADIQQYFKVTPTRAIGPRFSSRNTMSWTDASRIGIR